MERTHTLTLRLSVFLVILALALAAGFYTGVRYSARKTNRPGPAAAQTRTAPSSGNSGETALLSPVFTPEVQYWAPLINAWGQVYHIDPNLIATVIQIESCGDPSAVSGSGAQGLFQVMPFHFAPGEAMQDVPTNGRRGMDYLAKSLQAAGGDPGLALAGYNGGLGVIPRGWAHWSDQTRRYYQWGTGIYNEASAANSTSSTSATLQAWLNAGGTRLCQNAQARQQSALAG